MAEQPVVSAGPTKRRFPIWLIFVGVAVIVCGLVCVAVVTVTLLSPSISAARLPDVCLQNNPDMTRENCSTWADYATSTAEFRACFKQDAATGNPDANNLYACLVKKGIKPR